MSAAPRQSRLWTKPAPQALCRKKVQAVYAALEKAGYKPNAAATNIGSAIFANKLGQYRIILSADTASEVRQMLSQKRR